MVNADNRRRTLRTPIHEFCKYVGNHYELDVKNNKFTTRHRVRRVTNFLTRHPSVKTTADLNTALVTEFSAMYGHLSSATRAAALAQFRAICGLAVEWGYLKRNPLECYSLPTPATTPGGLGLDEAQVRRILAHLEAGVDTWEGHRLYALTATIIYAGLHVGEALGLRSTDYDLALGMIRVPRHPNS